MMKLSAFIPKKVWVVQRFLELFPSVGGYGAYTMQGGSYFYFPTLKLFISYCAKKRVFSNKMSRFLV